MQRAVGDRHVAALGFGQAAPPDSCSIARSMRGKLASPPCDQIFGRLDELRAAAELRRHSSAATMTCFGVDDVDAMGERGAAQIGVEQRDDAADAGDAEPDRQIFRPVRHHQADVSPLREILRRAPSAHSG